MLYGWLNAPLFLAHIMAAVLRVVTSQHLAGQNPWKGGYAEENDIYK